MSTYRLLGRMISYRPGLYALNALAWTLIHTSPVLPGLIVRELFDRLSGGAPLGWNIWTLIGLLLGVAAARVGLYFFGASTDPTHRFNMSALLRRNLLAHILRQPGARALPDTTGDAISRFRDDARNVEDIISWTVDMIGYTIFAICAMAILISIDLRITLLVFLPLAGVVIAAGMARKLVERLRQASSSATGRVTGALGEMFEGVLAIKVAGAEQRVIDHFSALNEQRRKLMLKDRATNKAIDAIFGNIVSIGTGLILIFAAEAMREQRFTVGDFALFVSYLSFVSEFTHFAGMFLAKYQQTGVSFRRMQALLAPAGGQPAPASTLVEHQPLYLSGAPPALESAPPDRAPADRLERLEVRGLGYRHPGSERGVQEISFELRRGALTVITGRIGAGKTTLLRALLGLLPADQGEVRWNGQLVEDPASFFVPPRSAYTPQTPRLFSGTVGENILLDQPEQPGQLERALRLAIFERDLAGMEQGAQTLIGPRGVRLSGGQVQRVAAARMFARGAELLVFDDLSSALDVETEQLLWERLTAELAGAQGQAPFTCLVVSHRRQLLQRASQVIVLADGRVAGAGTLEQLLESCAEMRELWQG